MILPVKRGCCSKSFTYNNSIVTATEHQVLLYRYTLLLYSISVMMMPARVTFAEATTMATNAKASTLQEPQKVGRTRRRRRRRGDMDNDMSFLLVEDEDGMEYHRAALILEHYHRHARSLDIIVEQDNDNDNDENEDSGGGGESSLSKEVGCATNFHHYNTLLEPRYRKQNARCLRRTKTFACLTDLHHHLIEDGGGNQQLQQRNPSSSSKRDAAYSSSVSQQR